MAACSVVVAVHSCCKRISVTRLNCKTVSSKLAMLQGVRDDEYTTETTGTFQLPAVRQLAEVKMPLRSALHRLQTCRRRRTSPSQHPTLLLRRGSRRHASLCQFSRNGRMDYASVIQSLDGCFKDGQNVIHERVWFNQRDQRPGEIVE